MNFNRILISTSYFIFKNIGLNSDNYVHIFSIEHGKEIEMKKVIITMSVVLGLVLGGLFPVSSFVYFEHEDVDCSMNQIENLQFENSCKNLEA